MEFDSIPLRSFWLDQFHAEVTYYPRTAIRGSRYRGDSWDNFLHAIPAQLLYHINGNAVYFVKHPWLVFLEQQLQEEASSENSSVAFDVRMAALTLEAPAFKPELAAAWAASVPPGENPYSDDSLLVGNYANTLLNESFDPGVFVRHGALSNILQNINESVITLAVQSFHELEDSLLLQSLREVNHPFREIIMLSSTASPTQQIQTVSGVSRLHYRVPARASELALCDLADAVETPFFAFTDTFHFVPGSTYVLTADGRPVLPYIPAMSQFCTDFAECVSSLDQAESFFGVRLNFHHDKYETLFETELVIEFCQTWRVAASGLGTLEDCDYQHGPTADDYIAWLISVDKSFNYVPKNKERVGWRPWTTLWSAPPPDVRNCSIYKSGDALERQQGIKECSLYLQESACRSHPNCRFRPIFGAGKCMSSSEYELLPEPVNIVTRTWSSSTSTSTTSSTSTFTSRLTTITPGNTRSSTMTSTLTHTLGTCEEGLPRGAGIDVSDCLERVAGESCQVRCTGLYSGGPAEFLCDGEFIGPEFQCQERTCSTQQLPLGFVTSGCEETRLGEICLVRCPQGFIPGESVWVCAADGQFYGFEPNCQALECGLDTLPEGIGFDASSCKGVLAGESCQVSCSYGFEGEASTFSCQENGALQGFAPICSKKTCAVPEFLQSARFSTTCASIRHGETCVSTCNFGFEGATTQLRCENGVLEGSSPTCTGLACSLQGLVIETGMDISNCSGTRSLESCMLGCFRGYTLAGDPHMTCQPSGQFLQEAFTCIPDSCGDLSQVASFAPPSVGTSCDSLVFGETCSAFCELGWELVGNTSVMVCEGSAVLGGSGFAQYLNGSFVPANETQGPSCQAQVCSQGLPSLKGVIHDCAGKTTGQSCTVSAAHGYEAEPTILTCGPEGSFEGAMPLIRPAACPNAEFPPGIGTTCNGTQVGAECWAYCEAGWFGASRRYECGLNTTLQVGDVEVISCSNTSAGSRRLAEETCFEASIAAIGLSDPRFTHSCTALAHGELCAAHCSAGYAMLESEPQLLVCEDGQIIGGLPSCNPQPCGFGFPSGLGVSHNCSAVPTEQTCTATCEEEYEYLVGGPETFQCMPSGNLLGNTPQCMRKQCNDLQLPPFYQHNCRSKRFGDTCGVNCVAGYHLTGWGSQFRCNGTSWLGSLPDCKPDPCEDISLGGELMGSCEGLRTGESCEVSCASGFEPNSSRLTCHGSGSLQGAIPSCQPALCGGEGQLGLASLAHNCIDVAFGRHCAVYCAPGYEIQGLVQEWRCGLNGTRLELSGPAM
ncbi:unnamed protein product [Effrenium voratum]|uniref:Sushi domain-containing protein n=1 Tax=Effrenium voratum TaxID=2562239 RepID=A0AA36MRC6_9DINO|nr:unnamed protein product [Effrenium voratum]